ncbi:MULTISPECIES: hypothetical protein [unclassified Rhizobium]|uniref:hypothetical protein n=1 Tax=unclassified Rhizobium TaxID=2613769 RepID=UPI0016145253|nr:MULTISPECIES: hypothetical protein [unclassified Rhizobium]MBB3543205.1 hypothetical protein [Rhizobium sp. BK399]MCS3741783.1 hypothetical protein [Rhizobium sp. BK661]MCS4093490.1 hypothetical protein [Rhizobium sp. BK176]
MFYVTLACCVIACAVFIGRYFAARTRLVEKKIDDAVARSLLKSPLMVELRDLREFNGVMRNLLIDLVENEDPRQQSVARLTATDRKRLSSDREQRRREIYGEAVFILQQETKTKLSTKDHKTADLT